MWWRNVTDSKFNCRWLLTILYWTINNWRNNLAGLLVSNCLQGHEVAATQYSYRNTTAVKLYPIITSPYSPYLTNTNSQNSGHEGASVYLSCDCDLIVLFISKWTLIFIGVVKCDADCRLTDPCLAILVDEFLQAACSHLQTTSNKTWVTNLNVDYVNIF